MWQPGRAAEFSALRSLPWRHLESQTTDRVADFAISPDDRYAALCLQPYERVLRVVDLATGALAYERRSSASMVRWVAPAVLATLDVLHDRLEIALIVVD